MKHCVLILDLKSSIPIHQEMEEYLRGLWNDAEVFGVIVETLCPCLKSSSGSYYLSAPHMI